MQDRALCRGDRVVIGQLLALSGADIAALAEVLADCVDSGASVSYAAAAAATRPRIWQSLAEDVHEERRRLFVARDAAGIAGAVQVILSPPEISRAAPIGRSCWCSAAAIAAASARH